MVAKRAQSTILLCLLSIGKSFSRVTFPCEDSNEMFASGGTSEEGGLLVQSSCSDADMDLSLCEKPEFQENCRFTCNTCCVDHNGKFDIAQGTDDPGKFRTCKKVQKKPHLCRRDVVRENCPVTCDVCPCTDTIGKFNFNEDKLTSCYNARKNPTRCRNPLFQEKCPGKLNIYSLFEYNDEDDERSSILLLCLIIVCYHISRNMWNVQRM